MEKLEQHPAGKRMPRLTDEEYDAVLESIRKFGCKEPIILHEGKILDGWHRYQACLELGVEPLLKEWDGAYGTPEEYVRSVGAIGRQLNPSQRALLAAEEHLANLKKTGERRGGDRTQKSKTSKPTDKSKSPGSDFCSDIKSDNMYGDSLEVAANRWGASRSMTSEAVSLIRNTKADNTRWIEDVRDGCLTVSSALYLTKELPHGTRLGPKASPNVAAETWHEPGARSRRAQTAKDAPGQADEDEDEEEADEDDEDVLEAPRPQRRKRSGTPPIQPAAPAPAPAPSSNEDDLVQTYFYRSDPKRSARELIPLFDADYLTTFTQEITLHLMDRRK